MSQALLALWTGVAVLWWLIAVILVVTAKARPDRCEASMAGRISVLKPLPDPVTEEELTRMMGCLESFVADLDTGSELVVGCSEGDRPALDAWAESMRASHPGASVEVAAYPSPGWQPANPKVAHMRALAERVTGELWLWSDADIEAPAGTMRSLRSDLVTASGGLVASPYVVRHVGRAAELLDALFVNLELYPGVVLLGRLGLMRFGLGAGMLFGVAAFRQRVDWEELGTWLADDFRLGRLLGPARLGSMRLATVPASAHWPGALLHYLRWQKTVHWCRPGAHAALVAVLPVLGWLALLCLDPTQVVAWLGLLTVIAADAIAAGAICARVGCRLGWRLIPVLPLWSLLRGVSWLACWFPWPVLWRGSRWWRPRMRKGGAPVVAGRSSA